MLDKILVKLPSLDILGIVAFVIAGLVTYGARFITVKILKTPSDKAFKVTIILKFLGVLIGILGFFRFTR